MLLESTKKSKEESIEDIKVVMANIKYIREYHKLTREAFAKLCNIPTHSYRILEKHGKGSVINFHKILFILLTHFNININTLLVIKC